MSERGQKLRLAILHSTDMAHVSNPLDVSRGLLEVVCWPEDQWGLLLEGTIAR